MPNSLIADLSSHFERHLSSLADEIRAYPDDASMWTLAPGILNSGGTLVLHMTGNLDHWIGGKLGGTGYIRDRAAEFADRDVPRDELLRRVDTTRAVVARALANLETDVLSETFPDLPDHYSGATTSWFLSHLTVHVGYHLGQLNYHRRILASSSIA